jgi:two-component system chemotaxis response regulator CheB
MIRVLAVDDSAFMRKLLSDMFAAEKDFSIIDTARNGKDAIEKIKILKPDLVTMDVEMPIMDGISALKIIMQENPVPIIMVSSLTREGAAATLQALELGAVDFVAKTAGPISNLTDVRDELLDKCRAAVNAQLPKIRKQPDSSVRILPQQPVVTQARIMTEEKKVAIGTSTGGPRALQEIITRLPGGLPCPVVIVQHMPPGFTKSLSDRLNSLSALTVKEAEQNDILSPGKVFIAPGDYHMTLEREGGKTIIKLDQKPPIGGHRPSVDPLMDSVARIYGSKAVGVILTGMGRDGSKGISAIKQSQGYTIAEDQSTCVVFGMPKSAIELGAINKVLPLSSIAAEIVRAVAK